MGDWSNHKEEKWSVTCKGWDLINMFPSLLFLFRLIRIAGAGKPAHQLALFFLHLQEDHYHSTTAETRTTERFSKEEECCYREKEAEREEERLGFVNMPSCSSILHLNP